MKSKILFCFIIAITFYGCHNSPRESAEKTFLKSLDSIRDLLAARDSSINEFLVSFNQIEKNLDSVARRENIISMNVEKQRGELRSDTKRRISSQISAINKIMEKNKNQIDALNQKLKTSTFRISEFQNIINTLNNQITQKNTELAALNERLGSLNAQVVQLQVSLDTLTSANYEQSELIALQTASIHTAYYVVGKSKELVQMKVIDEKGGLLGIGKTAQLSREFNTDNFTRVDLTEVLSIPINSKKAKVITIHPIDSYILDRDEHNMYTTLRIILPAKFWSASKYLVIINS